MICRITPRTNNEAVVLAALNYKIDLSMMQRPLLEYALLETQPYIPHDLRMRRIVQRNSQILRLDVNFNPNLPERLYSEADLRALVMSSGHQAVELITDSPYLLLQMSYATNNFYAGYYPNIVNSETLFSCDDISELDDHVLICYGSRITGLTALRYSELTQAFNNSRCFRNPLSNERARDHWEIFFPANAVRKLKTITSNPIPGESQMAAAERNALYRAIVETELFADGNNIRCRELLEAFNSVDEMTKGCIRNALLKLFELAMFMRGWRRFTAFPISGNQSVTDQNQIDANVTEALNIFESTCAAMGPLGSMLLDLPLLDYRAGEYVASADASQGYTIRERLAIVKQGDNAATMNSCIRISSNWLAASAHRYMQVVAMPAPFEIESLRRIM